MQHLHLFSRTSYIEKYIFEGNSAPWSGVLNATRQEWKALSHGEDNVIFHIFYCYYDH